MPELPEVETVRLSLCACIIGKKILKVDVYYEALVKNVEISFFKQALIDQTMQRIDRKGKYLIFVLDDYYLISHLRMEGKFLITDIGQPHKHEHVVFTFEDGMMRYHDTRKFGTMHLFSKHVSIDEELPLIKLGYEPFDERLTLAYLKQKFASKRQAIKTVLLDQTVISGLGNIYVDEVLFLARLHPMIKACQLNDFDITQIIEYAKKVLLKAIQLGGTTIRTFASSGTIHGRFQNELLVHMQKQCPQCLKPIEKIFVGGRGTYVCQTCQQLKNHNP